MKVQINAGALVAACQRYILSQETVYTESKADVVKNCTADVTSGWWLWHKTAPRMSRHQADTLSAQWEARHRDSNLPLRRAIIFLAIAKHKNPNTLLEITDPELEGIAPYLSEFNDPNGRIE